MIERFDSLRAQVAQTRSESLLALVPPILALGWVIVDAGTGLVAAERARATIPPAIQYVSTAPATRALDAARIHQPVSGCAASGEESNLTHGTTAPRTTLQRLCRAGLKFSAHMPNS